jgi:excisionase family DNA binding protein
MNNLIVISESDLRAVLTETIKTELANLKPTEPIKDNQLITRLEASRILGISLPTLGKYTKEGKIQSYRIGSQIRYKKEEILNSLSKIQSFKYH